MAIISPMEKSVKTEQVEYFKKQFRAYVHQVPAEDLDIQQNITLKKRHTERVCQEIVMLGNQLHLEQTDINLAEVMALFHDIGRFEQYARYRTFVDRDSLNHAEFGVKILKEQNMLQELDNSVQDLILRVISYHNRARIPQAETATCLFFSKLLRDADKLDIWRVVIAYYQNHHGQRNPALELNLPDTPGISEQVYADLMARRIVDIRHVSNLNDFKLLQIGWIYDINFSPTLQAVQERQYLEQIRATLPPSQEIDAIFDIVLRGTIELR